MAGERHARATFISDDFKVSDETYAWALDRLGSNEAVDISVERFRNHFLQLAGPKAKCRNWEARARIWIDDDAKSGPRPERRPARSNAGSSTGRESKHLGAFMQGAARRLASTAGPRALDLQSDEKWDAVLKMYAKCGDWTKHTEFGPPPDDPECFAPPHLLIRHGIPTAPASSRRWCCCCPVATAKPAFRPRWRCSTRSVLSGFPVVRCCRPRPIASKPGSASSKPWALSGPTSA